MVSWIIIIALLLILLTFFKFRYMQHRFYAIFIILLLLFLYVGVSKIIEQNGVDIKTFDGIVLAGKLYVQWLGHVVKNIGSLSGNAIKMNWQENSTLK